jgi:PRC-barrel domain
MRLEYLARHQHPRPPERDLRGQRVVDTKDNEIGNVAGLYVDRAERKLRFVHVVTRGFLGLARRHYLLPIEEVADETSTDMVQLRHDLETIQGAPEYDPHTLPSEDYQRAVREHYGYG